MAVLLLWLWCHAVAVLLLRLWCHAVAGAVAGPDQVLCGLQEAR